MPSRTRAKESDLGVRTTRALAVRESNRGEARTRPDRLAVEEPLEIRLAYHHSGKVREIPLSITMRTPGHDRELVAGFLLAEGIVVNAGDIVSLGPASADAGCNTIRAELGPSVRPDPASLQRHFYTTSSCGVCGKASLEALRTAGFSTPPEGQPRVPAELIHRLPDRMSAGQTVFAVTGGLHAAALFDCRGELIDLREDVGRHNALDKLIGAQLTAGRLPLHDDVLLLSGRASFELVQKALAAGVPVVAAVGAPSTLAVDVAKRFRVTLLGFVRGRRFNIYADAGRIVTGS